MQITSEPRVVTCRILCLDRFFQGEDPNTTEALQLLPRRYLYLRTNFAHHHNSKHLSLLRNNPVSGALRARELNSGADLVRTSNSIQRQTSQTRFRDATRAS